MKKTLISTFLFICFLLFVSIAYLSFFGYETNRFNEIIKSEIKKSNKNINIDFEKTSILLDIKKLSLFVKFISPIVQYHDVQIPLSLLRTDIDLEPLIKKKLGIKRIIIATDYLDFKKIKSLNKKINLELDNLKNIKSAKFKVKRLELEFDEDFELKDNFSLSGNIRDANIKITNEYEIKNLIANFFYDKNNIYFNKISWNLNKSSNSDREFFNGELKLKKKNDNYNIDLEFKSKEISNLIKIPAMNFSFSKDNISKVKSKLLVNKNKTIHFKNILIENSNNKFKIKNVYLDKDYNLIDFKEIKIQTTLDNKINNDFLISNKKSIKVKGKVFDAKNLIKELGKGTKKNKFIKKISKDVEIDLGKILKGTNFPIKNFRLIGSIDKGDFQKISAKSDYSSSEHLDISLIKQKETDGKILEVYSDIAMPLLSDYKFFQGLDGGNLMFISRFNKKRSFNELTIKNFKLNDAPALAKILTLADLKGLTDTLKGEGISFETLSVKYVSDQSTMTIDEIFMIGPSISVLIDGYVEKKSGLISLRGTLVPAKTLNNIVSKIPVVGDILIGKKVGEGVFGLSFKIKGLPDDLKTTVNPVKSLTPRFITRAVEAAKKRKAK